MGEYIGDEIWREEDKNVNVKKVKMKGKKRKMRELIGDNILRGKS